MSLIGIMLFAIMAAILGTQLKNIKSEYSTLISIVACMVIFFFILTKLSVVIEVIGVIKSYISIDDVYLGTLLKIVGISYIVQFSSDICKECGYGAIANQIQIFGKIAVLVISMPIVLALLETVRVILA